MCGRFYLDVPGEVLMEHFGLAAAPELAPRYNIAPTQAVAAVRAGPGGRELVRLRWGLVPAWAEGGRSPYNLINARAETVADRPAFRDAIRRRRCLVPASGFYEWQARPDGRQPWAISAGPGPVFAIAGLWERWEGEGRVVESCTLLVTEANAAVRPIHDRMPVILAPENYAAWLDPRAQDPGRLAPLLRPCPPEGMRAWRVGRRVNSPANDAPGCLEPLA